MERTDLDIRHILDMARWEPLQDALAAMTGMAIVTIDTKGVPVTRHSGRTPFCSVIREDPLARRKCFRCDALAGLEAVRREGPCIYLCHCGVVDVAVPILVGDWYLGAVMFGQVRLAGDGPDPRVERLVSETSHFCAGPTAADLMEKFDALPRMEYDEIQRVAAAIEALVRYIVGRAVQDLADARASEWETRNRIPPARGRRGGAAPETTVPGSSPVYPAVRYVDTHLRETIPMHSMADLCHLSPSYFSKLFHREVGESFSDYVGRRKAGYAKKRLRETSSTVTEIAAELGYLDASYFIKMFKKFEGITPAQYRRYRYV